MDPDTWFWKVNSKDLLIPGVFKVQIKTLKILLIIWSACKDLVTRPPFIAHIAG